MTNKEFEDKKQEIADYIEHNFRLDGSPKMDNTHKYVIKSVDAQKLVSMINDLQPPKPPTCATCEHFTQELSNTGYCHKGIGQDYIRFTDGVTPFVFMDFSCNKHSDYGDIK